LAINLGKTRAIFFNVLKLETSSSWLLFLLPRGRDQDYYDLHFLEIILEALFLKGGKETIAFIEQGMEGVSQVETRPHELNISSNMYLSNMAIRSTVLYGSKIWGFSLLRAHCARTKKIENL
jgi:hypothetical protein